MKIYDNSAWKKEYPKDCLIKNYKFLFLKFKIKFQINRLFLIQI